MVDVCSFRNATPFEEFHFDLVIEKLSKNIGLLLFCVAGVFWLDLFVIDRNFHLQLRFRFFATSNSTN
jgi:hypothetical protein